MRRRISPWIWVLVFFGTVGAAITALVALMPGLSGSQRASPERNAAASLKTVASAQADFRSNDRDGNGIPDFWRKDIAGLYTLVPLNASPTDAIRLIEISLAGADAASKSPIGSLTIQAPKAGYLYRTLGFANENPAKPDPDRFAAQAYPVTPSPGQPMFIISHANLVWKKAARIGGIDVFPADPAAEGWTPLR